MKSPLSVCGGNRGLQPAGTALDDHRHYCSTCRSYWDHEDGRCANLGRTMICDGCAHRLLGGQARLMSASAQPSLV
jgi:hypothetical protein